MAEPTSLLRCRKVMRWVYNHPTERRKTVDIARGINIPAPSINKTLNLDFPECFLRTPNFGVSLPNPIVWPLGVEFELDGGLSKSSAVVVENKKWEWDEAAIMEFAQWLHAHYKVVPVEVFRTMDKDDAQNLYRAARTMAETLRRIINADVIGTDKQATINMTKNGPVWK